MTYENNNLKGYITAVLKPFVVALESVYDFHVKYMESKIDEQDSAVTNQNRVLADMQQKVEALTLDNNMLREKLMALQAAVYSKEAGEALEFRQNENILVFNQMKQAILKIDDTVKLPDPAYPVLPHEKDLTVEWLETEYRKYHNIGNDVDLTESQRKDFEGYCQAYLDQFPTEPQA